MSILILIYIFQSQVPGGDQEVMEAMLKMVHSLIVSTETLFQHKSVSDKGGFKLVINGITVWKVGLILFNNYRKIETSIVPRMIQILL